jgi:DNA-binding PadR family transcriptional regulator
MSRPATLSLGEHVVLALLVEQPRHGWAIVRELAPGGAVGRIWSLSRPLTYRATDTLGARRLVRPSGSEQAGGPRRTILAPTAAGRRAVERWLAAPVEHPRDVRTELLLKLVLGGRLGLDTRPLLRAQRQAFRTAFAALGRAAGGPDADVVDRWRHESAEAIDRFLAAELRRPPSAAG